ncbi:4-hydroxybenzoate polyprenyltransferase [Streptomyces sp. WMMB 714]|uniref:SCO3242 family prenyltransferase n=1 Tax=Streptomyces sp. WMMB 714 TaxID=1286822 RepID=UPI0005F84C0B|nr:UbiA family prenyltransferase [Streptomyces sp. WMMB 714]SCK33905.1 4-hydroxybenzoate polyprenyltransferase [Streptomyces sp. WMMB 714]
MRSARPFGRAADWAQLLRISAVFSVPGDALAGAAACGQRADRGTLAAMGASLCLYEAGMALNDYSDREIDAVERPGRPLPSGRIAPAATLAASVVLTAAGLRLAAAAGRPALLTATALAGTVWAYDMRLKHTPFGPAGMAAARALDLVLGAVATRGTRPADGSRRRRAVAGSAALLGAHTYAVTAVSRHETLGAPAAVPLAALGATTAVATATGRAGRVPAVFAAAYGAAAARPLAHAAANPSPQLLQRAVGGGIRATIPLQAALAARAARPGTAAALLALLPLAGRLSRKVSPT